jgi:hypothetical protein
MENYGIHNSIDTRNAKHTRTSDYWLNSPIPTSNRFDGLENMSTDAENDSLNSETQKPNKPHQSSSKV